MLTRGHEQTMKKPWKSHEEATKKATMRCARASWAHDAPCWAHVGPKLRPEVEAYKTGHVGILLKPTSDHVGPSWGHVVAIGPHLETNNIDGEAKTAVWFSSDALPIGDGLADCSRFSQGTVVRGCFERTWVFWTPQFSLRQLKP